MKIKYIGGLAEGRVKDTKGREFLFKNGEPVEMPEDTADELLALTDADPTPDDPKHRKPIWEEVK